MHDSPKVDPPTDATLSKLLEVDAELAAQVAALSVQLEEVQDKRRSLQTVIAMFTPTASVAVLEEQQPQTATAEINGQLELATEVSREPLSVAPIAEVNGEVIPDSATEPTEKPQPSGSSSKRRSTRGSKAVKSSGRTKLWQQVMLPSFGSAAGFSCFAPSSRAAFAAAARGLGFFSGLSGAIWYHFPIDLSYRSDTQRL